MNETLNQNTLTSDTPKIIQTDIGASDGQNKCPKCGATEISVNVNTGNLRCHYCRYEFKPEKVVGLESDISELKGVVMGSGTQDIVADTNDILTFKCSSCGAEVVIDTNESTQSRCHWCRNTLSVNQQIPNGSVPDVVLPFALSKDNAKEEIEKFVGKRKFFAHPKFKQEFNTENIMGVYFPYMVVDINGHSTLIGEGEKLIRRYTRGSNDNKKTYYDADAYKVERDFDITIEGLTVESSSDKLDKKASDKTTNVINAIMPFDIENCVKWNSNYLKGYSSEKRDTNVENLRELVYTQSKDITRYKANETLKEYDRGVAWSNEHLDIKGEQWKSAYLPVWLYSYQQIKGEKSLLHYVAVNARTKETMGSVPLHMPKLLLISFLIELAGVILAIFTVNSETNYNWLFLLSGIVFYFIIYFRYRNSNARHKHELETKTEMNNLITKDNYIERRKGLSDAMISGCNNTYVSGEKLSSSIINNLSSKNLTKNILTKGIDDTLQSNINIGNNKNNKFPKWLIIVIIIIVLFIGINIISGIIENKMNGYATNYEDILNDYENSINDYESDIYEEEDIITSDKQYNLIVLGHSDHGQDYLASSISKHYGKYVDIEKINAGELFSKDNVNFYTTKIDYKNAHNYSLYIMPGYFDNIKAMLSGVLNIDGAILVVSASEGPMPQTRQYLILLKQLGIKNLTVFINDLDLVSDIDLVNLVEKEIIDLADEYEFNPMIIKGSAKKALNDDSESINSIRNLITDVDKMFNSTSIDNDFEEKNITKFKAHVYMLSTDEGIELTQYKDGQNYNFSIRDNLISGVIDVPYEMSLPGDNIEMTITLESSSSLKVSERIKLYKDNKLIGYGLVTEFID